MGSICNETNGIVLFHPLGLYRQSLDFIYHKNELNKHIVDHLPNWFLSGIPIMPKYLHSTTLIPWLLWRSSHIHPGDSIDEEANGDKLECHIEIYWGTSTTAPALFVVPDLIFLARHKRTGVDHYIQMLIASVNRKQSNQTVCVMRVDRYDSTILPDDVLYLDRAASEFRKHFELKMRVSRGSEFMFDNNNNKGNSNNDDDDSDDLNLIVAVGYSSGAVLLTKYLSKFPTTQPFSGATLVSSFFSAKQHFNKIIRKQKHLFRPFMLWSLKIKLLNNFSLLRNQQKRTNRWASEASELTTRRWRGYA